MALDLGGVSLGPGQLAVVAVIFLLAGLVKGTASFGMPLVIIPLMSHMVPVPTAASLTVLPMLVSNAVQAYQTRRAAAVMKTVWPLYVVLPISLSASVRLVTAIDPAMLYILIGVLVETFVILQAIGRVPPVGATARTPLLVASGTVAGVIGGATSLFAFPTLQLLFALRLAPLEFVFASSMMFLIGSIALGSGFASIGVLGGSEFTVSVLSILPMLAGLSAGQYLLRHGSKVWFRRVVLVVMAAMGVSMIMRAIG